MEPSPRKPFVRTGNNPRLGSSRASNSNQPSSHEQSHSNLPPLSTQPSPHLKYLPHATLLLKSFFRIQQQINLKYSFTKLKGNHFVNKIKFKQGLMRLKKVWNGKVYSNTMNAFATVFICEAQKAKIKKRELVTRNKALFLRLWKGVNHIILRKQSGKVGEAFGVISKSAKTNVKKKKLQVAYLKYLSQLFRQKLRTSFEIIKTTPLNRNKIVTLSFTALQKLIKTKHKLHQLTSIEILKRVQTKQEQSNQVKSGESINEREKQLKEQLNDLIRENKEGEERYVREEVEFEKRRDVYEQELDELRRRNERLSNEIQALKENHKMQAGNEITEIKVYENIYNNMLNFVHYSPEEMNKEELIQSLLVPLNEWSIPVDIIKMENECLQDLIQTYTQEMKVKVGEIEEESAGGSGNGGGRRMNKYSYEYLVKENGDLYGMLSILIENSKIQRNDNGFNELISSFVEIEDKFTGVYQKVVERR